MAYGTGRGYQGKQARGGCGRGRSNFGRGRGNNSVPNYKKELKFAPQGRSNTSTYSSVKEAMIQHVQKTYKNGHDIAKSLKDQSLVNLESQDPIRRISNNNVDNERAIEQSGYDIKYQEELRRHLDRKDALQENVSKAYALIFTNYFTKRMQSRIEEHPDFESTIEDDPFELLKVIKTLMHDAVRVQYPYIAMTDGLTRLLNIKQQENEQLLDYVKRFKQTRDVTKSQVGTRLLDTFIEYQEEYVNETDDDEKKTMKTEAYEKWMAYLLIKGSDPMKYGTLQKNLISQFSLGNDQYPKTITAATDVLSNHKIDQKFYDKRTNNYNNNRNRNNDNKTNESNEEKVNETSFNQDTLTCYCCGKKGHSSTTCDKKNKIPRAEWHVNRAMNNFQEGDDDELSTTETSQGRQSRSSDESSTAKKKKSGWSRFQTHLLQVQGMSMKQSDGRFTSLRDEILLDTGSTLNATFTNPDLVTNIRQSASTLMMKTNAGTKMIQKKADVNGFGPTWFDESQMANIFGFASTADKYRIRYDSAEEDAFHVYTKHGIVKFRRNKDGLYTYKPHQTYLDEVSRDKRNEIQEK